MKGFCEVCCNEAEADEEEPTPICAKCGHDLIEGVHVEGIFYPLPEDDSEDPFDEWYWNDGFLQEN